VKEVLEYLAKGVVDEPDQVEVTEVQGERSLILQLKVAPDDMGKVIGRRGRIIKAMRALVRVAGSRQNVSTMVEIVEE
jgi:predicted RNA-binding protein YlqC (UPF0109 family)